ncbi:MAG: Lrp/AsnC family transcriptional regulator [Candidatus Hadarchaeota archaeon]
MRDLDRKILVQLVENSSQSVVEISSKVGASRQTVAKKIKQFGSDGTIKSFTARFNPEKFGLGTKAYVFLREDPNIESRKKNEAAIGGLPQVTEFYRLFGRYSAVFEVLVKDSKELTRMIKKIHKLKGVRETETFIVHSTVKDRPEGPFLHILKT